MGDRPDFEIIAPDYATDEELRPASIKGMSGVDVGLEEPEPRPPVPAQIRLTAEVMVSRVRA